MRLSWPELPYTLLTHKTTAPLEGSIKLMMSETWSQCSFDWLLLCAQECLFCWETMWTSPAPTCTGGWHQKEVVSVRCNKGTSTCAQSPVLHTLCTPNAQHELAMVTTLFSTAIQDEDFWGEKDAPGVCRKAGFPKNSKWDVSTRYCKIKFLTPSFFPR